MKVRFVGIDPNTDYDHCQTVWVDLENKELLLQGWNADAERQAACEAASPAHGPVPEGETIIRVPARMVPMLREACDAIEGSAIC